MAACREPKSPHRPRHRPPAPLARGIANARHSLPSPPHAAELRGNARRHNGAKRMPERVKITASCRLDF